jgi:hypothetical protein
MTREADLTKAIARTRPIISYARERAMEHNHPEWHGDVLALLDLADEYLAVHTPEYQIDMVADHYDLIAVKAREIPFADDENMEPGGRAAALFGAVGQLIGAADGVTRAAAALGKLPTSAAQPLPEKIEIDRSTHQRQLDALLGHVREARDMIKQKVEPEATAPDQGPLEQAVISNYVDEMNLTDKSIHITISIGDGIDLAVLERFVSRLATATREMVESVKSWPGAAATRLRVGIEAVRKPVRRAVASIGGLILKLVRAEAKAPETMPPPPPPLPLPDDFLEQASDMIIAGQAPPAPSPPLPDDFRYQAEEMILDGNNVPERWIPHIDTLDFSETNFSNLESLIRFSALENLDISNTKVRDLAPIASLIQLKQLDISYTNVTDFSQLSNLKNLSKLSIQFINSFDLKFLTNVTSLKSLTIFNSDNLDLTPLSDVKTLEDISFFRTSIVNLLPLANLKHLKRLYFYKSNVSDLTPLSNLNTLRYLALDETEVRSLAPLSNIQKLTIQVDRLSFRILRPTIRSGSMVKVVRE